MPTQNSDFDVIIVGGGIVGLALAGLLAKTNLKIAVIDQQGAPSEHFQLPQPYDKRVSALNHASQAVFSSLDLWNTINALRAASYQEMQVWDANSPAKIHFSCTELGQPYLGHIVEHSVMRSSLWQYLKHQPQVQLFPKAQTASLFESNDQVAIRLENGDYLSAPLLVGADGADSWVAQQAKLSVKSKPYQQSAIVTTVHLQQTHQNTAWQRFLKQGVLAFLPLADPHWVSIVWSTATTHANHLQQLDDTAFNKALTQAIEYQFGDVQVLDKRQVFLLTQKHAERYIKPRIVLCGDAAHTLHPLAGQGINLGLADARCLTETLKTALQLQRDIGGISTLRRYERARKSENALMMTAMAGFKQLFGNQQEVLRHLRSLGFAFTQKLPLIKNYLMRYAMGLD
ncbi:MAG TPA: UbiH/UbiF/VisC/COQ6 family ubiquinone biosynthesis hydroxylase [Gammaproteobacteria bacterium]|nr:UbiH/UbiF/VisC/COQ6 family ubiquinone biosynthesis hydroxylase [Gammaproteobacteria bacterium]